MIWRLRMAWHMFRFRQRPVHTANPNFLFSTWPIPHWTGTRSQMLVTGEDSTVSSPDLRYEGPQDQPRLQQILDRLSAVGGSLMMLEGTFRLTQPLDLGGCRESIIMGCNLVGPLGDWSYADRTR